jgi:hypothetical protein
MQESTSPSQNGKGRGDRIGKNCSGKSEKACGYPIEKSNRFRVLTRLNRSEEHLTIHVPSPSLH